jgi:hypothetical protein
MNAIVNKTDWFHALFYDPARIGWYEAIISTHYDKSYMHMRHWDGSFWTTPFMGRTDAYGLNPNPNKGYYSPNKDFFWRGLAQDPGLEVKMRPVYNYLPTDLAGWKHEIKQAIIKYGVGRKEEHELLTERMKNRIDLLLANLPKTDEHRCFDWLAKRKLAIFGEGRAVGDDLKKFIMESME